MVSKGALFQQWLILMKKIKSDTIPMIYSDAKRLAMDYQMAKLEVENDLFNNIIFLSSDV
jgi:hypothetical protein